MLPLHCAVPIMIPWSRTYQTSFMLNLPASERQHIVRVSCILMIMFSPTGIDTCRSSFISDICLLYMLHSINTTLHESRCTIPWILLNIKFYIYLDIFLFRLHQRRKYNHNHFKMERIVFWLKRKFREHSDTGTHAFVRDQSILKPVHVIRVCISDSFVVRLVAG